MHLDNNLSLSHINSLPLSHTHPNSLPLSHAHRNSLSHPHSNAETWSVRMSMQKDKRSKKGAALGHDMCEQKEG